MEGMKKVVHLSSILKRMLPPIPVSYDPEKEYPNLKLPYGNGLGNTGDNAKGDCVEVAKYIQQLIFEMYEQGTTLPITEKDVVDNYLHECGGKDIGLVMLDAMKQWQDEGLPVGVKRRLLCLKFGGTIYKIKNFVQIQKKDIEEVKLCISLLGGMPTGLLLSEYSWEHFGDGKPWDVTDGPGGEPNPRLGHGVDSIKYEPINEKTGKYMIWVWTWGGLQPMTSDYLWKHSDERYAVIDAKNRPNSPIDPEKKEQWLPE